MTGKHRKIHRLVAQTYIPNPMNKPQVNHIDCDKTNNNINNLEWCTNRENVIHAMKNGMIAKNNGEFSGTSKLKEKDIIKIRKLHKDGMTQQNISKLLPVKREAIGKILRGERWAHVK